LVRAQIGVGAVLDRSGIPNSASAQISRTYDSIPPTVPGVPRDTGIFTSVTALRFTWTAAGDSGTGVASYDLQVGTSPGSGNVFSGNVGNVLTRTVQGANGTTLYARVRARDRASNNGLWSASSDGITVDTVRPRVRSLMVANFCTLDLTFDEPVRNAERTSNYSCTRGLDILGVQSISPTQFRILTAYQRPGSSYTLTISNTISDRAGNPLFPSPCVRSFTGGVKLSARQWQLYQ